MKPWRIFYDSAISNMPCEPEIAKITLPGASFLPYECEEDATYFIENEDGERIYLCTEHKEAVKAAGLAR